VREKEFIVREKEFTLKVATQMTAQKTVMDTKSYAAIVMAQEKYKELKQ
jgi:hypothetical protein